MSYNVHTKKRGRRFGHLRIRLLRQSRDPSSSIIICLWRPRAPKGALAAPGSRDFNPAEEPLPGSLPREVLLSAVFKQMLDHFTVTYLASPVKLRKDNYFWWLLENWCICIYIERYSIHNYLVFSVRTVISRIICLWRPQGSERGPDFVSIVVLLKAAKTDREREENYIMQT